MFFSLSMGHVSYCHHLPSSDMSDLTHTETKGQFRYPPTDTFGNPEVDPHHEQRICPCFFLGNLMYLKEVTNESMDICFTYGCVQPQGYSKVTVGGYPNAPIEICKEVSLVEQSCMALSLKWIWVGRKENLLCHLQFTAHAYANQKPSVGMYLINRIGITMQCRLHILTFPVFNT